MTIGNVRQRCLKFQPILAACPSRIIFRLIAFCWIISSIYIAPLQVGLLSLVSFMSNRLNIWCFDCPCFATVQCCRPTEFRGVEDLQLSGGASPLLMAGHRQVISRISKGSQNILVYDFIINTFDCQGNSQGEFVSARRPLLQFCCNLQGAASP